MIYMYVCIIHDVIDTTQGEVHCVHVDIKPGQLELHVYSLGATYFVLTLS